MQPDQRSCSSGRKSPRGATREVNPSLGSKPCTTPKIVNVLKKIFFFDELGKEGWCARWKKGRGGLILGFAFFFFFDSVLFWTGMPGQMQKLFTEEVCTKR